MHGCGDSAMNFATWAVNPYDSRQTQNHIGISIGGQDGNCWGHQQGCREGPRGHRRHLDLLLRAPAEGRPRRLFVGRNPRLKDRLAQSAKFAGILIENAGLGGAQPSGPVWKINVAHVAHKDDSASPSQRPRPNGRSWRPRASMEGAVIRKLWRALSGGPIR